MAKERKSVVDRRESALFLRGLMESDIDRLVRVTSINRLVL
jgi:hypothetical protein